MNTTMLVGVAMAFVGFTCFAGALFSGGGVAKSEQFRVIGEVMSGRQGPGRKRVMSAGMILCVIGALTTFAGVAAHDAGRGERCRAWCAQRGYTASELRRVEETAPSGRTVAYFGCVCAREDGATTQTRANDL